MKRLVLLITMAFAVTLAIMIATRLSDQAIAMIIGVALGVLASIPTSLVVVFVLRQRDAAQWKQAQRSPTDLYPQQPPVFIVTGGGANPISPPWLPPPSTSSVHGERAFTIVGEESTEP